MTDQKLYRIEEYSTTGWEVVAENNCTNLTKEVCTQRLNDLMTQGYNPNKLRAVIDE